METIILKIILCSGIVLGLYYLFLAKEKTLTFNRFYLLLGLIFSYSIPFVTIETKEIVMDKPVLLIEQEIPQQILQNSTTMQAETFDYTQLLQIIYFVISGILIAKILYSILKIKTLKGRKIIYQNRNVILLKKEIAPFSFLSTIYLSEKYFKDKKIDERIFLHEEIHVKQNHSFDVLLIEVVKAFSWFNPFIYFYKNVMITNHEFLADEEVIIKNENIKNYQKLILNEVLKQQNLQLTHQFNFNNTKKRFIMMTKTNSKFAEAKKYLAIPLFVVLAGLFVEKVYAKDSLSKISGKSESIFAEEDPYTEFNKIIKKYGNLMELKKYAEFEKTVSLSDREKLKDLYFQLTKEQRDATPFYFFNIKKSEKINVTQNQLNDFKNSKKYGLWIDGKKTKNQDLQNYKPEDFSHQSVSKRYPNAISAKNPEPYQVNLMTHQYFQNYQNEKEKTFMGFKAKAFIKGKDTITPGKNVDTKLKEVNSQNSDSDAKKVQDLSIPPPPPPSTNFVQAEFPGGANNFRNKIAGIFDGSIFKGDEGTVKSAVYIAIDENGNIDKVIAIGDNKLFNNEAERAVKSVVANTKWKPATDNGKQVRTTFSLPLTMKFENYQKTQ